MPKKKFYPPNDTGTKKRRFRCLLLHPRRTDGKRKRRLQKPLRSPVQKQVKSRRLYIRRFRLPRPAAQAQGGRNGKPGSDISRQTGIQPAAKLGFDHDQRRGAVLSRHQGIQPHTFQVPKVFREECNQRKKTAHRALTTFYVFPPPSHTAAFFSGKIRPRFIRTDREAAARPLFCALRGVCRQRQKLP